MDFLLLAMIGPSRDRTDIGTNYLNQCLILQIVHHFAQNKSCSLHAPGFESQLCALGESDSWLCDIILIGLIVTIYLI